MREDNVVDFRGTFKVFVLPNRDKSHVNMARRVLKLLGFRKVDAVWRKRTAQPADEHEEEKFPLEVATAPLSEKEDEPLLRTNPFPGVHNVKTILA